MDEDLSTQYEQGIICPYCKHEFSDPNEYGDENEIECDCGESFDMIRNVEITYSTFKKG